MWKDYELIEARFTDVEQLTVLALFKMPSGEIMEEHIEVDPDQLQYKELMKLTTEKQIHEWTYEWKLAGKRHLDSLLKPEIDRQVEEKVKLVIANIIEERDTLKFEVEEAWGHAKQGWEKDTVIQKLTNKIADRDVSIQELQSSYQKIDPLEPTTKDLLDVVLDVNTNEDTLFKLKLSVFEKEKIKKSKNRKFKTDIRKTKTVIDLLKLIQNKV